MTTHIAPDGSRDVSLDIHDNGRGPKMEAQIRIQPDGTLSAFDAKGHGDLGEPIDEHFAIDEHRHATWKSTGEAGEKDLHGDAFYLPLAPLPDVLGLLVTALQKAGGTIALLPEGTARLEKVAEASELVGDKTEHLTGYSILGLDFTPTRVWIKDDGDPYGFVSPNLSCVVEGGEGAIDDLIAVQQKLDRVHDEGVARRLAHRPPEAGLAFTHARVLDSVTKRWLVDQTVIVVGSKIKAMGPSKIVKPPSGAEVVDATDKALIPGLWDMHSHLGPADGVLDIASGVTTARDVGNDPDVLDDFKKRFDDGTAVGPHVLRAGFIEGRGEDAAGSKVTAETEEEAKKAVEFYAQRGYEQIKIYNSMKPDLVPVLAKAAHAKGMRVSGHVPAHMLAEEAIRGGYDEINHVNFLFLNFLADHETRTNTPLRFSIVAEKAGGLDLSSKPVKDFIALMKQKKTTVDPTLGVFEAMYLSRLGQMSPTVLPFASRLPASVRRTFLLGGLPVPEGQDQTWKDAFAATEKMVKLLHDSGIPIGSGTDSFGGLMLHRELELYVQAGLSTADAIETSTLGAARIMRKDKTTGSIAVGKDADLVLVDGDPLIRMEDIRRVVSTVRGGVVFPSGELYETVGVAPWK
jgi:hypothetical protein